MTNFTKSSFKALAVLAAICIPFFTNFGDRHKSPSNTGVTTASDFYENKFGSLDKTPGAVEPKIAAANPVDAQSWTQLSDINNPRFESTVVQYRDDLFVFNGFGVGVDVEPAVEMYNAGTQTWSVIGNTSIARGDAVTHNGVIKHGNEVWIIGGRVGDHPGVVTSKVWIFNLTTHEWSAGPQMPVPVAAGGAALVDNRIHWFGGLDADARCDVDNHYVYDLDNPSAGWSNISGIAPMPIPRNHFATVVHDGLIYAIGGQFTHDGCRAGTPDTDLVHVFDPSTNIWTQIASLPAIQSHIEPSTFVHKDAIYVVGGATSGNRVYRYDPSIDNWDTVAVLPQALLAPIARVIDGQLIVSSGGAPAIVPSKVTYATDMTPLLLPGAATFNINDNSGNFSDSITGFDIEAGEGLVTLEAEYHNTLSATATHQWVSINNTGASNNTAMTTTPNNNTLSKGSQGSPSMSYFTYFDRPGTWYLWIRGSGDTVNGEGGNDSLHAGLNGSLSEAADKIDNFPEAWSWTSSTRDGVRASLNIPSTGIHAVNLWMREDGLAVDKILLTTDANYKPSGFGDTPVDNEPSSEIVELIDNNTLSESETQASTSIAVASGEATTDVSLARDSSGNSTVDATSESTEENSDDSTDDNSTEIATTDTVQETSVSDGISNTPDVTADNLISNNGIVVLEVEKFDSTINASNKQWVRSVQSGASGNAAMVTTPNTGVLKSSNRGSPVMNYQVFFDEAGTYKVWLRGWGDTVGNEGKNDSAHVGINGNLGSAAAIQNFPSTWRWSNEKRSGGVATLVVPSSGKHTINIWMREDGLILDKLILSKSATFTPTGPGPTAASLASEITTSISENNTSPDNNRDISTVELESGSDTLSDASLNTSATVDEVLISVEVENYGSKTADGVHLWIEGNQSGASGLAMEASPNVGKLSANTSGSAVMNYPLRFTEPGTYFVWLRGWGDTVENEGKNDSVYVGVNGILNGTEVLENFPADWTWSNKKRGGGRVTVNIPTTGEHVLNLRMREDGIVLDKMILTKDATLVPGENSSDLKVNNTEIESNPNSASANFGNRWLNRNTADGSTVQQRHEAGGVTLNGKIYVLGGRGTRNVSVYDPIANKWSQKAAAPIELNHFQPVAFNNKIWVLGAFTGRYPNEISVASIYSYTPASDTWKTEGTIPQSRRRGSTGAVLHRGLIYVVGGNNNGHNPGAKPWLDSYNPTTGEWQILSDAPNARDHITVSVSNNKLVLAAGRQSAFPNVFANTVSATNIYDFDNKKWSAAKSIPTQRAGAMTVVAGDEVVVIGGEVANETDAKTTVESYNVVSDTWRQLASLKIGRHSGVTTILNNEIHVISGSERRGGSPESTAHEVMNF